MDGQNLGQDFFKELFIPLMQHAITRQTRETFPNVNTQQPSPFGEMRDLLQQLQLQQREPGNTHIFVGGEVIGRRNRDRSRGHHRCSSRVNVCHATGRAS